MKTHIISHTHWDREWYKTFQYFNVKLHYLFEALFHLFETEKEYKHFMLDGQMLMIEDYLNTHPTHFTKIKQYVEEGKLIIGPWYSQPDEFSPDAESLVRNLLYGINMAKQFGPYMKVGYLPDSFGQSAQLPHILKGFNIDSACIMRGVPVHKLNQTEFIWKALNDDQVLAVALPKGYSNGMFLPLHDDQINIRVQQAINDLQKYGNKENFLIMNGVDHQFPQEQLLEFLSKHKNEDSNYLHSTLEDYINDVKKQGNPLVEIKGELITPVTNRVHTSIASSRMYQKTTNRRVEILLEQRVEPLLTLSWVLGANYPKELIDNAWKLLLQNQSHDSIGGCCTDEVHREMEQRFTDINNSGKSLWKAHARAIASLSKDQKPQLVVFNDSLVKGRQLVKAEVFTSTKQFRIYDKDIVIPYVIEHSEIVDTAAFSIWSLYLETPCPTSKTTIIFEIDFDFNYGYKRLNIVEDQKQENTKHQTIKDNVFENKYTILTIQENGSFNLYDKATKKIYRNLNQFEDCGDAGDTYNYSPVLNDFKVTSETVKNSLITVEDSSIKTEITVTFEIETPFELINKDKNRSTKTTDVKYEIIITMYNNQKRIDICTNIDNTVRDHRVRVLFPSKIKTDYSYAEVQYGVIKRPIKNNLSNWEKDNWAEKPLSIYSMQRFVALSDGSSSLAILNKGLTEYEIYEEDNTIAVTLFRGVGFMGKADLLVRPGRPSGVCVPTPDAQMLGKVTAEYSIFIQNKEFNSSELIKEASMYSAPALCIQNQIPLTNIYTKFSYLTQMFDIERVQDQISKRMDNKEKLMTKFITIDSQTLLISAIKKAENEDALVLRLYNSTNETASLSENELTKIIDKASGAAVDSVVQYSAYTPIEEDKINIDNVENNIYASVAGSLKNVSVTGNKKEVLNKISNAAKDAAYKVIVKEKLNLRYDYFYDMLLFVGLSVSSLLFAFLLKIEDKRKGYGLELPNIEK